MLTLEQRQVIYDLMKRMPEAVDLLQVRAEQVCPDYGPHEPLTLISIYNWAITGTVVQLVAQGNWLEAAALLVAVEAEIRKPHSDAGWS